MPVFEADDWILSKFESDEGETIVRSRASVPEASRRISHAMLVLVQWPYEPDSSGFPNEELEARMETLEDALQTALADEWAVEAASITGCGMREWRYYTPNPNLFTERFSEALAAYDPFPVQLSAFEDPDWNALSELLPAHRAG